MDGRKRQCDGWACLEWEQSLGRSRRHSSVQAEQELWLMKFGIHNSSWLDAPDPAEAFEAVKAKAQWGEGHGFVWFSVLDHMIQIPRVGAPDEPFLEGWTVLASLAAVTGRIRLATLATAGRYSKPPPPRPKYRG